MARHQAQTIDLNEDGRGTDRLGDGAVLRDEWLERSRLVVTPIAPPSILGLFGLFTGTILVGTNLAGWWGSSLSTQSVFPFALAFAGLTQILAAMWSFKARDALAVALHGTWGSFWIGWGILQLLYATGVQAPVPLGTPDIGFGVWFVPLCAITTTAAVAALTESIGLFTVYGALAGAAGINAAGLWVGSLSAEHVAGWFLVVAAAAAWYVASAMLLTAVTGRTVLPLGKYNRDANIPLHRPYLPIDYPFGQPGARLGQ